MDDVHSPHPPSDRVPLEHAMNVDHLLVYIHYYSPIVLLVLFLTVFTIRSVRVATPDSTNIESNSSSDGTPETRPLLGPGGNPLPQRKLMGIQRKQDKDNDFSRAQKLLFLWFSVLAALTFAASCVVILLHVMVDHKYWCGQQLVVYQIGTLMDHVVIILSLVDAKPSPTAAQISMWTFSLVTEICRLSALLSVYGPPRLMDIWLVSEMSINAIRIVILVCLVAFFILFVSIAKSIPAPGTYDESTALLRANSSARNSANGSARIGANGSARISANGSARTSANGSAGTSANSYGAIQSDQPESEEAEDDSKPGWARQDKLPSRGWWEYIRGFSLFFPYLWPAEDRKLQMAVLCCIGLVLIQRGVNVLVPYQLGVITDMLSDESGNIRIPWQQICIYIGFRMLQGSDSIIGAARGLLWIPVSQYSYRELSVASFEHVHSLSLDFHLGKKTGELISALGKGNSINNFLEQVTFNIVPMLIDLAVAIGYFLVAFDVYYALVVVIVTFWYIYYTIRLARWRADSRRQMVKDDRYQDAVKNDSMISYETVKYFNAEDYEFGRYRDAVCQFQKSEYNVTLALSIMSIVQNLVFMLGLIIVCFIAAYQVTLDQIKVGKFVTLIAYMTQLQQPLNFFGQFYKGIQSNMINAERLLELFKEQPTVVDEPGVKELKTCKGDIRFKDVRFAYDTRKNALNGMDFHCKPGTTTAFVGESGGGKSTVFRILFRFYSATKGSIEIDGKDVQKVTIDSLRRHIGVVPQDTVLFNETLMYNLKYAKPDATDETVYEACKAACIHERIMSFPDQYNTQVGERGLKLSGGEKQRVAIARTIIKSPKIIMLDEATAALDTTTEQHIQNALNTLSQGRTMLVIAHRLSTIASADQILVLHEGRVVERGNHNQLLEKNGHYKNMWQKQVEAQEAATQARDLKMKANRLRRESKGEVALEPFISSSNETSDVDENDRTRYSKDNRSASRRQEDPNSDDEEQLLHHEALEMRHSEQ